MTADELSAEDQARARQVARLTTEFVLRALNMAAKLHDGDLVRAMVAAAIVAANTAHLGDRSAGPARHASLADIPPDAVRRPVSVMAVAQALGLPFETTRRYVNRLIALGQVKRVKGGVIGLTEAIARPENEALIVANTAHVRRFLRDLGRIGFTA